MREGLTLECSVCGNRNYRTEREMRSGKKLEIKKYCKHCRKHTVHKERRR